MHLFSLPSKLIICFYSKVKTLGESDSEDDVSSWVKKSRKIQKDKELAEKRVDI